MTTLETSTEPDYGVLDNAAWSSLTGPHARFAQAPPVSGRSPSALRYPADVSPFAAVAGPTAEAYADLAELFGPGAVVALSGPEGDRENLPAGWTIESQGQGVQLVATERLVTGPADEAVRLGAADAQEMLGLVARTRPGPFEPRTHELGTYLGIRREGKLVAMAGERLHPPGWTEISAVCTDEAYRGQGLATRLVRAVAHEIRERGETPLMHAAASNENAIRLYLSIGFHLRLHRTFSALRTPE
jgi:ribosomal protein S18 acetylase RimI-like enzyme